jgi:hypothetical protein
VARTAAANSWVSGWPAATTSRIAPGVRFDGEFRGRGDGGAGIAPLRLQGIHAARVSLLGDSDFSPSYGSGAKEAPMRTDSGDAVNLGRDGWLSKKRDHRDEAEIGSTMGSDI